MENDVVKRRVQMNQDKMDYMKKEYGDTYLSKFGMMVLSGYTIQEAIDACWKLYKPKEEASEAYYNMAEKIKNDKNIKSWKIYKKKEKKN